MGQSGAPKLITCPARLSQAENARFLFSSFQQFPVIFFRHHRFSTFTGFGGGGGGGGSAIKTLKTLFMGQHGLTILRGTKAWTAVLEIGVRRQADRTKKGAHQD